MTDITYSGSGTINGQPGTIAITVHPQPQQPPPPATLFPPLFFNGAAFGQMNLGPSNWSTRVVSGTITLDIDRWDANGPQPITTILMQWMVDNVPVGAPVLGPPIAFQLDTTQLADGTHFISGRVLNVSDPTGQLSAYQLNVGGVSIIVQNHGPVNGPQMVPVADHGGNNRQWPPFSGPASVCDFVHYPGAPFVETGIAYPVLQHIPPAYDPASPFHANPAALRDPNNWTTEPLLGQINQEYSSISYFNTTLAGGVGVLGFSNQSSLTVEGDYDIHGGAISRHARDGGRGNALIDAYSTLAENSSGVWEFLEIGGRFGSVALDGTVTTLAGNKQDPARLPLGSQEGTAADYYARKLPSGGLTAQQWGGINDFVEDTTNAHVRYFANQIRHTIIRLDLSTGAASIYAGQDGVSGYVDGPRASSAFASPSSITCADGSNPALPAGTLIIADKRNAAIRLISPSGAVSTLAGGMIGPTPVSLATYNTGPATYVPHSTRPFSAAYLPSPQTVDTFSNGSIMVLDDWSTQVSEVDPQARTVRYIGQFAGTNGQDFTSAYRNWGWASVDSVGACGPLDDIFFNLSDGYGAAELTWRTSRDGTYSAGFVSDHTPPWLGFGHYPWAEGVSTTQGRFMSNGFANVGLFSHHIKQAGDVLPPTGDANYVAGEQIWQLGTVPGFPFGSRPSFSGLHGPQGHAWIGTLSVDEMQAQYPDDASLSAFIHAGMGGTIPRPEITGLFLSQLIYWIRRTATQSVVAPTYQFTLPSGYNTTVPVISNVAAVRNGGVINVTWTTDRPTIGLAAGGTRLSFATGWRYTTWSPIEATFSTSHSVTLIPPTMNDTHVAVLSMDVNGNQTASSDILIP